MWQPALELARSRPRTTLLTGCLLVSVWSAAGGGPEPLERAEGFDEAVQTLVAAPPDFVLVWPPEAVSALDVLPAALRAADALPLESPERRRYRRLAMLAPRGTAVPPELHAAPLESQNAHGEVEVTRFTYPAAEQVLFDLYAELAAVRVSLRADDATLACDARRADGGLDCPGQPEWNHAAPTTLRVEGRDWPCVWSHPVQGKELVFQVGPRALGDRVVVEAALSDGAALMPGGAAVELTLEVGGQQPGNRVQRRLVRDNRAGVVTLSVDLPEANDQGEVTLRVRTRRDARRHLGINLRFIQRPKEIR